MMGEINLGTNALSFSISKHKNISILGEFYRLIATNTNKGECYE